jgi:hypothetical protein
MQEGGEEGGGGGWKKGDGCTVSRPTKLIDGSRGGQVFVCELLKPKEGEHYGIEQQARMQFLSVLLVVRNFGRPIPPERGANL